MVDILYAKIKELRYEQKKLDSEVWSNLTIIIKNSKFRVEYDYEDLSRSDYNSYERHIIWRYYVLGVALEQCTKEEREIIRSYESGAKLMSRKEEYEVGIYIKNIKNIVDYSSFGYESNAKDIEYIADEEKMANSRKNQILMDEESMEDEKLGRYEIKLEEGKQSDYEKGGYEIETNRKPKRYTLK